MPEKPFCGFLLGPTAVGKTALSFYLAEKLSASVLNSDSIQMYKGLDIGSAKPKLSLGTPVSKNPASITHTTLAAKPKLSLGTPVSHNIPQSDGLQLDKTLKINEQQNIPLFARLDNNSKKYIPCFLFDEWEPPFTCTAGTFRKKALSVLKQELSHHSVLIVGGSGFYIQALEKGMYPIKNIKPEIKEEVQEIYKNKGLNHLYKLLVFLDPKYAHQISPRDKYRIFRGICIILSEEKPVSVIRNSFQEQKIPWPYIKVGLCLPREVLGKRVQERTEKMIKEGLIDETQVLLDRGFKEWPVMKSVGYKEAVLYLENHISKEELKTRIVHRTMQFAKKQMSWFKRDKNIHWYSSEEKNWHKIYKLFLGHP